MKMTAGLQLAGQDDLAKVLVRVPQWPGRCLAAFC